MAKSDRLIAIERLLLDYPQGLKRSDIAKRLGVHRSTISRDIATLEGLACINEDESGLLCLEKSGYLATVRLTMFELEALHLSARLFARVMKFPFPHAGAALRKLSAAQGVVSARLASHIRETADEIERFPDHPSANYDRYRKVIEQLGTAITENRSVHVRHFSRSSNAEREYTIFPLTLEPHHEGRAVHLIAWDIGVEHAHFRTLKIERISSVIIGKAQPELLSVIPHEEASRRLASAWGIWATEGEPVCVTLHFSAAVASRVTETMWHVSQRLEDQPDGSVLWRGKISEPQEMYPWIRGWGPDVLVVEPESLRQQHMLDFRRGVELYSNISSR